MVGGDNNQIIVLNSLNMDGKWYKTRVTHYLDNTKTCLQSVLFIHNFIKRDLTVMIQGFTTKFNFLKPTRERLSIP